MAFALKTDLLRTTDCPTAGLTGAIPGHFAHATADAAATVVGAGYFNTAAALLPKGSVINSVSSISGTPVRTSYVVTANDGTTVTIA